MDIAKKLFAEGFDHDQDWTPILLNTLDECHNISKLVYQCYI